MTDKIKFAYLDRSENIKESIFSDFVTFSLLIFCIYISSESTWWTFVTGLMFLVFIYSKISSAMGRYHSFKTKKELSEWVDSLPDDKE